MLADARARPPPGDAGPPYQALVLTARLVEPFSLARLVLQGSTGGEQLQRLLDRSGRQRRLARIEAPFGLLYQMLDVGGVDGAARGDRQAVTGPATVDRLRSQRAAQAGDQRGDVLHRPGRDVVRPQHLEDRIHRHVTAPPHGEQLEQQPSLSVAEIGIGHVQAAGLDDEATEQPQPPRRRTGVSPHGPAPRRRASPGCPPCSAVPTGGSSHRRRGRSGPTACPAVPTAERRRSSGELLRS